MAYIGNATTLVNFIVDNFTGTGAQVNFTLTQAPASASAIIVSVDGVKRIATGANAQYVVNGDVLTFTSAPALNAKIEVVQLGYPGVDRGYVADGGISTAKLADGAVTGPKIGLTAINANNIVDGTITGAKIATGTITGDDIATNQISGNLIQAGAVSGNNITANAIRANNIVAATITGNLIATGQITGNLMGSNAVGANNIVANTDTVTILSVPAGVYGNATFIPSITVSANGRISAISNSAVSGIDAHPFVFTALGT